MELPSSVRPLFRTVLSDQTPPLLRVILPTVGILVTGLILVSGLVHFATETVTVLLYPVFDVGGELLADWLWDVEDAVQLLVHWTTIVVAVVYGVHGVGIER